MAKYIFIYREPKVVDMSDIPEEEIAKVMELWGEWLGNMGKHVVDGGDAFKAGGKRVSKDGVADTDNLTSGYTSVEAANFDEALEMAQKNPSVADGSVVEVYEAFGLSE